GPGSVVVTGVAVVGAGVGRRAGVDERTAAAVETGGDVLAGLRRRRLRHRRAQRAWSPLRPGTRRRLGGAAAAVTGRSGRAAVAAGHGATTDAAVRAPVRAPVRRSRAAVTGRRTRSPWSRRRPPGSPTGVAGGPTGPAGPPSPPPGTVGRSGRTRRPRRPRTRAWPGYLRSEEHTSELQSRE